MRRRAAGLLPQSAFARNVAKLAGGAAIGQLLIIVATPFITRLYTPEDVGVLEVYINIAALLIVIACLRYEVAIPLPKEERDGASLLLVSLTSALVFSLLSGVIVYLLADSIVAWTGTPLLKRYLWLMPVGVFGAAVYNALNYWNVRQGDFNLVARTRATRAIVQVIAQLGLGLLAFKALGLLLGYVAAQFSGNGALAIFAWRKHRGVLRTVTPAHAWQVARRYKDFPLLATLAALLNIAPKQMPGLLLAAMFGPAVAGFFGISQRVIRVPATIISTSISQVFMNRAAKQAQDDLRGLPRLFFKAALRLFLIGIGPAVLLVLTAPWLTSVAFGGQWHEAGIYIQLVTPALLLEFIVSTLSPIIYVVERQGWQVIGDIIRFSIILTAFYVARALSDDPRVTVAAYSAAMLVTYLGFFVLYGYAVKWRARVGFPTPPAAPGIADETPA
jgi:O-antigen/teichoic acid export membrane protein